MTPVAVEEGSLLDLAQKGHPDIHPDVARDLEESANRPGMATARQELAHLALARDEELVRDLTLYDSGVDFSYTIGQATAQCIRGSRGFVCVYMKWTGRGSILAYQAAGLRVVPIYETTGTDYRGGVGAGNNAARAADAWCNANGFPGAEVYNTFDEDVLGYGRGGLAHDYDVGWNQIIGVGRTNSYGQNGLVGQLLNAGVIHRQWVTYAWSGGGLDGRVTIYQNPNDQNVCGVSVDFDRAFQPTIGAIGESAPPPPPPPPPQDAFSLLTQGLMQ